jgi:hypothetical protein
MSTEFFETSELNTPPAVISNGYHQRMSVSVVAPPRFEPTTFWSVRSQVPPCATFHTIRRPKLAGLGTGKAHRYFAFEFAVLHAFSQYSNAVLDREKIDEDELHESCRNCFKQLKRKENALVLSHGPFLDQKVDWTDLDYKND